MKFIKAMRAIPLSIILENEFGCFSTLLRLIKVHRIPCYEITGKLYFWALLNHKALY